MLKRERLTRILQMVNEKGIVDTADIMEALAVSDMTVRRDLDELEKSGKLIRVRGGAQSLDYNIDFELSHLQKSTVQIEESGTSPAMPPAWCRTMKPSSWVPVRPWK